MLSEFLRYSRYSSCGRDKLSEASGFYLCGCKVPALRFLCVDICRIARRFEFCMVFGILRRCRSTFVLRALRVLLDVRCSHFAPPALGCCVLCPRRATLRVASYVVWYRRSVLYVWRLTPHIAPLCEISCEVARASFDALTRIRVLRVSCVRSSVRKLGFGA